MKIILSARVAMNLEGIVHAVGRQEFSGVGFCDVIDGDVHVYDIELLNVGSFGYTEINPQRIIEMTRDDKNKIRLWFHRHPLEGWSGTDVKTILETPLGGVPEIIKWSASIVRTPTQWIGRVDNYITHVTQIVEVTPNIDTNLTMAARMLLGDYYRKEEELTVARRPFYRAPVPAFRDYGISSSQSSFLVSVTSGGSENLEDDAREVARLAEIQQLKYDEIDDWIDTVYVDDQEKWFDDDAHAAELNERYKKARENRGKIYNVGGLW